MARRDEQNSVPGFHSHIRLLLQDAKVLSTPKQYQVGSAMAAFGSKAAQQKSLLPFRTQPLFVKLTMYLMVPTTTSNDNTDGFLAAGVRVS